MLLTLVWNICRVVAIFVTAKNVRYLKLSSFSLVIKNNLTFAITYYFHFRKTAIVTYLLSLQ